MIPIKPLEPPDSFSLSAAEGWLELGNLFEAYEELEKITSQLRAHPDVLALHWRICAKDNQWVVCAAIAKALTQVAPANPEHWLLLANSLRNARGPGLEAAMQVLLLRMDNFPKNPFFSFYLACCSAQLNRLADSYDWWERALTIAKANGMFDHIRLKALDEPDLEPLLKAMGKI